MKKVIHNCLINLVINFLPIIFVYNFLFYLSMEHALDRGNYILYMASPDFGMRGEPLLVFISKVLGIYNYPVLKLVIVQNFFIFLLAITFIKISYDRKVSGAVAAIFFGIYLIFFALVLNIQLRIGYAITIFVFIYFFLKKDFSLGNFYYYLLPIVMHSGVFFLYVFLIVFKLFKIKNLNTTILFNLILFLLVVFIFNFLIIILPMLGVSNYYLDYFDSGSELGENIKVIPLSLILYFMCLMYLFKMGFWNKSIEYWFCFSGIVLVLFWVFSQSAVFLKFLIPLVSFVYFICFGYFCDRNIVKDSFINNFYLYVIIIVLSIVIFISYCIQYNLNLSDIL